jgi:hypothetical protein
MTAVSSGNTAMTRVHTHLLGLPVQLHNNDRFSRKQKEKENYLQGRISVAWVVTQPQ